MLVSADVVFASNFPMGLELVGLNSNADVISLPGKDGRMIVLNDRPINAETPPYLLDPELTPGDLFFCAQ